MRAATTLSQGHDIPAPATAARPLIGAARRWLPIAGLVAVTMLLRLPYLDAPISADEGGYATAAYWWARGDTLYQNITITRPQGIFVVFRAIDALGLGTPRGIHLVAALWLFASALLLWALVARVWDRRAGFGAALLFAAAMSTPWLEGYQANAELFMTLPLLGALWCLVHADRVSRCAAWLAASGLLGAIALLVKPSAAAVLALAVLWLLRGPIREQRPWRATLTALLALVAGAVAGLLPALLHGLLTAPARYLNAVLFYRLGQDSLVGGDAGHQLSYFVTNSLYIVGHLPLLLLAPFGFRLAAHAGDRRGRDLLALWTLTALGGTALGGNWFLHYYQQLLPPLAIAVVLAVRWLLRRPFQPARFALGCLATLAALALLLPLTRALVSGVDPATLPEWEPGVRDAAPVAAYLRDHTGADESIYVVYDHADIYYFSGRRPAARWLHFRELRWTPGAFDEQVARLADPATAPRYLVQAQDFDHWGFDQDGRLRALVARDYAPETTIGSMTLYRRK